MFMGQTFLQLLRKAQVPAFSLLLPGQPIFCQLALCASVYSQGWGAAATLGPPALPAGPRQRKVLWEWWVEPLPVLVLLPSPAQPAPSSWSPFLLGRAGALGRIIPVSTPRNSWWGSECVSRGLLPSFLLRPSLLFSLIYN